jgi:hypothetical protein
MLHTLKSQIDREVSSTRLASELLDVAVIVVANPVFHDLWRLAAKASVDVDWLDNSNLWLNGLSESEAELNGPNVLALDFSVDVVWA